MNPSNMVFHIIDSTEDSPAAIPLADDPGVVLCFVSSPVFLAGEATLVGLRAPIVAAEEVLAVAVEMLPQVTAPAENSL